MEENMNKKYFLLVTLSCLCFMFSGCAKRKDNRNMLLPSTAVTTSQWKTYEAAKANYRKVVIGMKREKLRELGYYDGAKNVVVLSWLDVYERMPEYAIETRKLDKGILLFIDAGNGRVKAFDIDIFYTHTHREGNAFLDIFNFRRMTRTLGYTFNGMILLVDGSVTYILKPTGGPVDKPMKIRNPLGPFQEIKIPSGILH